MKLSTPMLLPLVALAMGLAIGSRDPAKACGSTSGLPGYKVGCVCFAGICGTSSDCCANEYCNGGCGSGYVTYCVANIYSCQSWTTGCWGC